MAGHQLFSLLVGTVLLLQQSAEAANMYGFSLVPKYIFPGQDFVVTVDLKNYLEIKSGTFDVSVDLKVYDYRTRSYADITSKTEHFSDGKPRGDIILQIPEELNFSGSFRAYVKVSADGMQHGHTTFYIYPRTMNTKATLLIQTDKGMYKAGQTVQFRAMSVNEKRIIEVKPMTIEIFDGDKNRVRRWANVSDSSGVFVGKMEMSEYPVLGTWSIQAKIDGLVKSQSFDVKEFELPKFDVTLDLPNIVSADEDYLEGSVTSTYTFGKGVTGSVELVMSFEGRTLSQIYKLSDGEATLKIATSDIKSLSGTGGGAFRIWSSSTTSSLYSTEQFRSPPRRTSGMIKAIVTVTEDITGITRNDSVFVKLVKYNAQLTLDSPLNSYFYYTPGQSLNIEGHVTSITGSPFEGLAYEDYLTTIVVNYRKRYQYTYATLIARKTLVIDSRNKFVFKVDENLITTDVEQLYAKIELVSRRTGEVVNLKTIYFYPFKSTNGTSIGLEKLSGSDVLNVGEIATYRIIMAGTGTMTATYSVISKGVVVKRGPWFSLSEDDPYDFHIQTMGEMVPSITILAWFILPTGRIGTGTSDFVAATAIQISVKKTTPVQDTTIEFVEKSVRPRNNARLNLQSSPRSSFYILAVDKSVLLLDKGNDITESILPKMNGDPAPSFRGSQYSTGIISNAGMIFKFMYLTEPVSSSQTSTYQSPYGSDTSSSASTAASLALSSSASSSATSSTSLAAYLSASSAAPIAYDSLTSMERPPTRTSGTHEPKQETVRKIFPDTWLFMNVTADSAGRASIVRKVPDTVTTWLASCFAVSAQSMITTAISNAELEVFQPFFISLQLPFSVIRNEQLVLQANIFNYHTKDLYVLVTLKKSSMFRGLAVVKRGKRRVLEERCGNVVFCVFAKAGRGTAAFFPIIPTELGKIKITITAESSLFKDTVVKFLRVESEGAPKDVAYPVFIDLTGETTFETQMDLNYPPNTVEGSQRMRISVIGDVMGPTIDGLDKLVRMPYGCGEQNMVSTAPSIFVYKYLKAVGKLTDELKERAETYMRIGMQRQLRYKHSDWSFSAWGGSGSGSTWLTAFVLKVFAMASSYVEVDDQIVTRSAAWLINTQYADGSFPEKGTVSSGYLQGSSSGTAERMTAYVLIALIEGKKASSYVEFCPECLSRLNTAINKASSFLSNRLSNQTSVYTVAISSYALTLAGHSSATGARNLLGDLSKTGLGQKYWEEPNQPQVPKYHYGRSTRAASIEMTAYALLAFTDSGDIVTALLIQKWLIGQRNPYGGFISTQDTVIALQGMAEIGSLVNANTIDIKIMVSYTDTRLQKKRFTINARNSMTMQLADISTDTKAISVHAWGTRGSAAILTVSLFYNIFMDLEDKSLRLDMTVSKETINGYTVTACVSWLEKEVSGMIVVEVGIPSGFEASRYGIFGGRDLKKIEIENRKVVLYYDEVTFAKLCTDIPVVRDKMVANVKPVPCKAYEYYEPSNEVTVFYVPLSAKNSNICDICGIECGCKSTKEKLWFPQSWCKKKIT